MHKRETPAPRRGGRQHLTSITPLGTGCAARCVSLRKARTLWQRQGSRFPSDKPHSSRFFWIWLPSKAALPALFFFALVSPWAALPALKPHLVSPCPQACPAALAPPPAPLACPLALAAGGVSHPGRALRAGALDQQRPATATTGHGTTITALGMQGTTAPSCPPVPSASLRAAPTLE